MKLLEENIGKTFIDVNCTSVFLGQSPKAIEIKAKINKWDLIKLRFCAKFLHSKGNHKRNKRTINEIKDIFILDWEKIFANEMTNKGLICKIKLYLKKPCQKNGQKI